MRILCVSFCAMFALTLFAMFASVPVQPVEAKSDQYAEDRDAVKALRVSVGELVHAVKDIRGNMPQAEAVTEQLAQLRSSLNEVETKYVSTQAEFSELGDTEEQLNALMSRIDVLEKTVEGFASLEARVAALESKGYSASSGGSTGSYKTTSYGSSGTSTNVYTQQATRYMPRMSTSTRCRNTAFGVRCQ